MRLVSVHDSASYFPEHYRYRLRNIVTNEWVKKVKLGVYRSEWLAFISLCYRLNVPIKDVPWLTADEQSTLYLKGN